jgi:hypothetical protein
MALHALNRPADEVECWGWGRERQSLEGLLGYTDAGRVLSQARRLKL